MSTESTPNESGQPEPRPLVVIKGEASPEEVAALVAVVQAMAARGAERSAAPRSLWASPARRMRRPLSPGRDGWRASVRPG